MYILQNCRLKTTFYWKNQTRVDEELSLLQERSPGNPQDQAGQYSPANSVLRIESFMFDFNL